MIQLGIFISLLIVGFLFGRIAEKRHFKSIVARELASNSLVAVASRFPPENENYEQHLVVGNVVVASDYFKSAMASLINFFGGRVTPFESLLDRARREAILRMKHEASLLDAKFVFNVKLETSRIATGQVGAVEVVAYGTALTKPAMHVEAISS